MRYRWELIDLNSFYDPSPDLYTAEIYLQPIKTKTCSNFKDIEYMYIITICGYVIRYNI